MALNFGLLLIYCKSESRPGVGGFCLHFSDMHGEPAEQFGQFFAGRLALPLVVRSAVRERPCAPEEADGGGPLAGFAAPFGGISDGAGAASGSGGVVRQAVAADIAAIDLEGAIS